MSKKVYAVVVAATTGIIGVAEALVALFNPPFQYWKQQLLQSLITS